MDLVHDRHMPDPIDPHLSHTAYRRIYDHDGLPLAGRFALEFVGPFVTTNQPETATKVARTVVQFSGVIQPPPDVDLVLNNSNGERLILIDQDGIRFGATGGGEPIPITVSAARAVRDLALESVLVALGIVVVGP